MGELEEVLLLLLLLLSIFILLVLLLLLEPDALGGIKAWPRRLLIEKAGGIDEVVMVRAESLDADMVVKTCMNQ